MFFIVRKLVNLIIQEKQEQEKERKQLNKCNLDIRSQIKKSGLTFWAVADRMGIADTTFSKWLRKELSAEKKQEVINAINEIQEELKQKA